MSADSLNPRARQMLLGREQELEQLDQMIDRLGTRGGALIVRGEAGIGKSTLLNAASERARDLGVTVVATTGAQSEARFTFGGLHQLLRPFLDHRHGLPAPQRRALEVAFGLGDGAPPDVFMVAMATLSLLTETASTTPLLLIVDDAHWLDQPSSEALAFVARRLDMEVLVLLIAVREDMPNGFDEADLPELRVAGLSSEASRELLQRNGARLAELLQDQILAEALGNPLALIELPKSAVEVDPAVPRPALPLTARLESAFTARLSALDADVRTLLLLAALDDRDVVELSRAAEDLLDTRIYLSDWNKAVASGCGTVLDNKYRFRHPLIRSAVQQSATEPQRRQAHAALARAQADDPDRAVWHQAAAAEGPDDKIAESLVVAADRAESRGGHDVACQALERAAALTSEPRQRASRLQRAGEIAMYQGRSDDAVAILREALKLGLSADDSVRTAFNLETMTSAWSGASTIPRFAEIAKDIAATGDNAKALDRILLISMRAFWGPLDDSTRQEVASIVADLTVPEDNPQRLSALALIDPVHRGREVIDQVSQLSPVGLADPLDLMAIGNAANAVWADDLALPFLRSAVAGLRADGRLHLLGQTLVAEAWADVNRGAARLAMTGAAEAARICEETGAVRYVLVANLAHAIAAAGLGDTATAERLISESEAALVPMGANPLLSLVALARGRMALAIDHPAEAYADLLRIFTRGDAAYQPFVRGWALADLVDAAVHGDGDLDLVRAFLREWDEIAAATHAPHLEVQLAYAVAVLADDARAEELFGIAMTSAADGWPVYVARAQLAYGQGLRRQHRDIDSRVPLREAAQGFEALGQLRYADRALRELRASGERARRRVPEAWTELSPQELQIAQLAADGLSNREIGERLYLSHRTIGTHLYNLFPKLGITSRAQLRAALEGPRES